MSFHMRFWKQAANLIQFQFLFVGQGTIELANESNADKVIASFTN